MVDFVKIEVKGLIVQKLLDSPLLEFEGKHSLKTGEVRNKKIAKYRNLDFIVFNTGFALIQGSLHKYKNEGRHNYDDFSYKDLQAVLSDLERLFGLSLENCIIRNIEFGMNITPPENSSEVLKGLLLHKTKPFKTVSLSQASEYLQAVHQQYIVKVYNKALQFGLQTELLRIEIKYRKMNIPHKFGIKTLEDLRGNLWLQSIINILSSTWDEILLFDSTINRELLLPHIRNKKYYQWSNLSYWQGLSKVQRHKQRINYQRVVVFASQNVQAEVKKILVEKGKYLSEKGNQLTSIQSLPTFKKGNELTGKAYLQPKKKGDGLTIHI